jgi:hypothetical protein
MIQTEIKLNSQKAAILYWLIKGNTIDTLSAAKKFGCTKLPNRIKEFESAFKFKIEKRKEIFLTDFGTQGYYFIYQLNGNTSKTAIDKIKNYLLEQAKDEQSNTSIRKKKKTKYIQAPLF